MKGSKAGWLIGFGWLLAAACLLYRSGLYPAAMTGDEIWFSDSAWHLLVDGRLRRPLHSGALSSEIADFLPPLTALIQALCFALFGVNAFAVGFQSVLAPLAIGLLVTALARRYGAQMHWAALAGFAALGTPSILRAALYIRYEALVLVCLLAALLARPPILRGALIGLAGLAYYPTAPFVGLAALAMEISRAGPRPWLRLAAGFAIPVLAFALWIAAYPAAFTQQVLQNGAGNYLTFELPRRLLDPDFWRGSIDALPEVAALLLLAGLVAIGRVPRTPRGILAALAILMLPLLIYPFSARLLSLPSVFLLIAAAQWATAHPRLIGYPLIGGAVVASIVLPMLVFTAWFQSSGRDTRALSLALDQAMTEPGLAVIDQRAWLALKMAQPDRPLLQVMPASAPAQALAFQPKILLNSTVGTKIQYLVLNGNDFRDVIDRTPALRTLVGTGICVESESVIPSFKKLAWARNSPYELIVYRCR